MGTLPEIFHTLFLNINNDFPDSINSKLGIYAYDTNKFACLTSKYGRPDKWKQASSHKSAYNQLLAEARNVL